MSAYDLGFIVGATLLGLYVFGRALVLLAHLVGGVIWLAERRRPRPGAAERAQPVAANVIQFRRPS
jgi:hypothetical protein